MLYFNKIFDFEERLNKINAMSFESVKESIAFMFDETQKAVALIGNTDKPL